MREPDGLTHRTRITIILAVSAVCAVAAALMIWRGPGMLADLSGMIAACF
jgi:hypothetical protein